MRLLRFLRHFALNCLNCLTFLTRTLNLIMSLLFPTFVLIPISACSFFDNLTVSTQPVPFLLYLFLFCLQKEQPSIPPCVFFCSSPSKLVSFLSTLCLSLFSLYFFLYFSSKINTSYSSHLSVTRSTVFSVYCF